MSDFAHRVRRQIVLLVAAVLAAACLVAPAAADVSRVRAPHRWAGYAIAANGDADGGWIGGYRVGGTSLFLTTPTRNPNRAGYESQREIVDLPGRAASRSETARAAWILSKYGAYRDATQAAAVDATVYHLLVGGRWKLTEPRGAWRIRHSGDPASVARFARIMLRQARRSAGRYSAELTTAGADVGGTVAVTLSVTNGHGRPAAGLPVTLAMSGVASAPLVTGDDGRAVARFAADARGWQAVSASVSQVPDHRLHAWTAEKKGQASAAEGGARRTLVVTAQAAVRGPQTLSMAASPATVTIGTPIRVVGTVSGDGASRTGTATLHGPFASAGAAQCAGQVAATVSLNVAADGDYAWPAVSPGAGGFYAWRVAIDGTDTSLPVSACGATTKVRAQSTTSISGPTGLLAQFDNPTATVGVAGLPFPDRVELTVSLFGPYTEQERATQACNGPFVGSQNLTRHGNGSLTSGPFFVEEAGYYAWRVQAAPGELWLGSSACLAG